jgi:hypothetical protein
MSAYVKGEMSLRKQSTPEQAPHAPVRTPAGQLVQESDPRIRRFSMDGDVRERGMGV